MAYVGDLFTCVDFHIKSGREEEFLSLWRGASEWAFVKEGSPRAWFLIQDPDNPGHFRSLTLWPTGMTLDEIASDEYAAEFLARCQPICNRVEAEAFYLADAFGGVSHRTGGESSFLSIYSQLAATAS